MTTSLAILLILFVILILLGLPIAWCLGIASAFWVLVSGEWIYFAILPQRLYEGMDVFILMAIPFFILMGELISEGKITGKLMNLANGLFGWMKGGLAQINISTSILFSGITGTAIGDIAALGKIFIPAMTKEKYARSYAAAVTAASSVIGPMVPPSLIIVIYGSVTGLSVGALFAACIIPGVLVGIIQMLLVSFQFRGANSNTVVMDRSPRAMLDYSRGALVPLLIPVVILVSILGGYATPTEAGAIGVLLALVITVLWYKTIDIKELLEIFSRSMMLSGQLIIIVGCGAIFSWVLAMENVPELLTGLINNWNLSSVQTLLIINIFLLVLGMFIDPTTAIILFAPILSLVAGAVGIDPLHFAVIMILNLNLGLLTPPLGICLLMVQKIADCRLESVIRSLIPFFAINLVALLLVTYLPELSLFLPGYLGY